MPFQADAGGGETTASAPSGTAPETASGAPPAGGPIPPYGGALIDRTASGAERDDLLEEAKELPHLPLSSSSLSDLFLIAVGALSPLEGFMDREACESVVERMKLPSGLPWTLPVTLGVDEDGAGPSPGDRVALVAPDGGVAGILDVTDVYARDWRREAVHCYGTEDLRHPGVAALRAAGDRLVAGPIRYTHDSDISGFPAEHLTPAQTRRAFDERGWRSVVAFQTRNPIHRAHEYLQKCALELVDGLLVHPLVGETKADDVPAEVRMECYRIVLERYFPAHRVLLSPLPVAMRYAGPKEAVFHAILRRNYGCTHFIVGRDHAGVGDYYGTYDAQRIFDEIDPEALGIRPLRFEHAFWCSRTGQMGTERTSPSAPSERVLLSGTKLRELLMRGERPPVEYTRPEVADVLMKAYRNEA